MLHSGVVGDDALRFQPKKADIDALMRAVAAHPLGISYLRRGHLGTVAITFGCHAFTVVAARDRLETEPTPRPDRLERPLPPEGSA